MCEPVSIESRIKWVIITEFPKLRKGNEALTIMNICPEDNLEVLGIDSIDKVTLYLALEENLSDVLDGDIPDGAEEKWLTVSDVINYVKEHSKKVEAT